MEVTGKASLKIMKNSPFSHVNIQMENLDLEQITLKLTPMEARCNHCNVSLDPEKVKSSKGETPRILVVAAVTPLGDNSYELDKDLFFVHESCLEEFIPSFLNPPSEDAEKEEVTVVDMAEVVKTK